MPVNLEIQPNVEEVWSKERGPIKDRMSYFFNNEFLADITFVVGFGDQKTRVPAHKFILSTCSWQFYNALYLLHLDNDEIKIEDVDCETFLCFLEYCYTGEVDFDALYQEQVLKLAYRFNMKHLIEVCENEIQKRVNAINSLFWLDQCKFLPGESKLRSNLLAIIAKNFVFFLRDEYKMTIFNALPLNLVTEIVSHVQLTCDEMQVFDVLMKWSTYNCQKRNVHPIPINLRLILKDVFYKIRFPVMKENSFLTILSRYPNLLTPKEIKQIGAKIIGDSQFCDNYSFLPRINDTSTIKSFMDFSEIETHTVIPCFSKTLKLECKSPNFSSSNFKFVSDDQVLIGIALLVKRDQIVQPKYYTIRSIVEPMNMGSYTTMPEDALAELRISKRYQINWNFDLIFLKTLKNGLGWTIKKNVWYRLYCEFDTALLCDFEANPTPQLQIWKEKIPLIPYLYMKKKN